MLSMISSMISYCYGKQKTDILKEESENLVEKLAHNKRCLKDATNKLKGFDQE